MRLKAKALSSLGRSNRSERQVAFTRDASFRADATRTPSHRLARLALLAAISTLALLALAPTASASRSYDSSFGTFTANNGPNPQSIAVDQSGGDVYVADIDNGAVHRFDANGAPKNFTCGTCSGNTLTGLALDPGPGTHQVAVDSSGGPADGNIYVANSFNGDVVIFDNDGSPLGTLLGTDTPDGGFFTALGVAVDQQNGDLYVANGFIGRVWRYAPTADLVAESDFEDGISVTGNVPAANISVAFGKLYVTGAFAPGIVEVYKRADFAPAAPSPTPTVLTDSTQTTAVDPSNGDVYADKVDHVDVYDSTGALRFSFGSSAEFGSSSGVAVKGSGGPAYVADGAGNEVDVYIQPAASRSYDSSFGTFTANNGPNPQSIAVDQSGGDVYVADIDNGAVHRFDANGAPKNFTCGTCSGNTLTGLALDPGPGTHQVAVDSSGGPADGNIYVANSFNGDVVIFDNDGSPLGTLLGTDTPDGGFFTALGVAVDQQNGDLYVANGFIGRVWRYAPTADLVAESDFEDGISVTGNVPAANISVAFGKLYVTGAFAPGIVEVYKRADFAPAAPSPTPTVLTDSTQTTAVDPSNGDVYADKVDHVDVYDSTGALRFSFGSSAEFGSSSGVAVKGSGGPAYVADGTGNEVDKYGPVLFGRTLTVTKNGPGAGTVTSDPNGINCGPSCESLFVEGTEVTLTAAPDPGSRLNKWTGCDSVAGNECTVTLSADREVIATFTAKPAVTDTRASRVGTSETTVQGPSATLEGKVNPNGEPTTYHFEYGTQGPCGANACTSTANQGAGFGTSPVSVSRNVVGLEPATTYHFRLVATNAAGTTAGTDLTFTTYPADPTFDGCENDEFRTGPSAKLPDCRAYEQASPVQKNGTDIAGDLNFVQTSPSGDAVTFFSLAGLPGAEGGQDFGTFMARRGDDAWTTHGLLPPAGLGTSATIQGWPSDLSSSFSTVNPFAGGGGGSQKFYSRDSANGSIAEIDSNGGPFIAASADDNLVYFRPSGLVSVWNRETDVISQATVLPDSACPDPPCYPSAGAVPGAALDGGELQGFPEERHVVSADGDRLYFSDLASGQLYLREDPAGGDPETKHVSASHKDNGQVPPGTDFNGPLPARFHAASIDGSKAIFSSAEELTNDANTGPNHLPGIGRADVADAGNPNPTLIAPQTAKGIAVDDNYLYWADPANDSIGRSDLDGSNPDPDFITGADDPQYVALDETSAHIYWTNASDYVNDGPHHGTGSIGRADLPTNPSDPPTNVTQSLLTGLDNPQGIAIGVGADSGHLYWANSGGGAGSCVVNPPGFPCGGPGGGVPSDNSIGRAEVDGTDADRYFLELSQAAPQGIAINASHIYASTTGSSGDDRISRWDLPSAQPFVDRTTEILTGADAFSAGSEPRGIAVDSGHVYWALAGKDRVARADLDLTNRDLGFLSDVPSPYGLDADASYLYWASNPGATGNPGSDLYVYDAESEELTDLTPHPSEENGADVQGVLGTSDNGETVYFVANGVLASNPGANGENATPGDCVPPAPGGTSFGGQCNLYVSHAGGIDFIARLDTRFRVSAGGTEGDESNWQERSDGGASSGGRSRTARVSSDGDVLVFRSHRRLTAYDNSAGGACDQSGTPEIEGCFQFYRYDAESGETLCVSCNPTGAPSTGDVTDVSVRNPGPSPPQKLGSFLTRNVSTDGARIFFETGDKLVAADTNGDEGCPQIIVRNAPVARCQDVYEWEAEGTGSCDSATQNGGCLYLVSAGTGSAPSYFADASSSGDEAFLFTRDPLVPADRDQLQDVYRAGAGDGLTSQHVSSPPECEGDLCQGNPSPPPADPSPGSSGSSGPGNQGKDRTPPATTKSKRCKKGKKLRKGKCVKKKRKRNRSATTDRGGSK